MTAPNYSTDLILINDAESGTWVEMGSPYNAGGAPDNGEQDYFIQGAGCTSQSLSSSKSGLLFSIAYDNASDLSGSFATDDCFFMWQVLLAGNAMETFANGGLRAVIGADQNNADVWFSGGSDFGRNPYGGWQNVAIDPTYTPVDQTIGGGSGGAWQFFGSLINTIAAISKGQMHGVDALRYGRGELIVEGGDGPNGFATFDGMAANNDSQNNRWGLFQDIAGGFLYKGLMSIGSDATAVNFVDLNKVINIDVTPRTYSTFNKIEINNSNTRVNWDGILISSLDGTSLSPGQLEVTDATADVTMIDCAFTDMDTLIFQEGCAINGTTFRRCGLVSQNNGTFDGCTFDESDATASIFVTNLDNITNSDFTSDGLNHAIELSTDHAGGTFSLDGCTFNEYAISDGDTGNESIYNNSGGAVTINIINGSIPSVRNGVGASTTVILSLDWYFEIQNEAGTIVTNAEFRIYDDNDNELYGVETSSGTEKYTFSGTISGTDARIVVLSLDYLYFTQTLTHPSTSNSAAAPIVITLVVDRVYDNP
ncbi:MAG: hypothetical protein GOV02_03150 [Candidatus Aenigmarchaeota archaeon]|nr:hypothetical protein [Candidatus Aenigmarchaeota archaeon]